MAGHLQHGLREANLLNIAGLFAAILAAVAVVQENWLVLAALAILALVVVAPVEMSLGVFAFSVPFDNVLVLGNNETSRTSLSWLAGAFAGVVLLTYGLLSGRFRMPPHPTLWWGLFSLWTVLSIVWAIDPATSLQWLPTVASLFVLYLVTVSLRMTSRELSQVLLFAIAGGAVAAAFLLYHAHYMGLQNRATLVFGNRESNPNDLGVSLLLPFSLALGGFLSARTLVNRALMVGALALVATAIFLTMSRGALVAFSATLLVFLLRLGLRKRMLIPILIVVLSMHFLPDLFYERLKEAPAGRGTGRLDIILAGAEVVKSHPVIGVGLANFSVAYDEFAGYAPVFRGYGRAAHNVYLQVWAETGVIGLALFLAAIYLQMKQMRPAASWALSRNCWEIAVNAACWGLLVAGFSGSIQWSKTFWLGSILLALTTRGRHAQPGRCLHC